MKQAAAHIVNLIEPVVEGLGYECVGIEYNPHPQHGLLRIYIDKEQGILVEDCSRVSHQLSGVLDVEDAIPGNYHLEVSSPGADRPLFKITQFQQFQGHSVTVHFLRLINNRRKVTGLIQQVQDELIFVQEGELVFEIPFTAISKARLVPQYLLEKGGQSGK